MLQGQMANEWIVNSCGSKTGHCWTPCQDKTTKMHFANIQMGNFIWGRVYGLGKIGRGKVYDSLQEYSPLNSRGTTTILESQVFTLYTHKYDIM